MNSVSLEYAHPLKLILSDAQQLVADIEMLQKPLSTVPPSPTISSTTPKFKHIPCSASYYIISNNPTFHQKPNLC